MAIHITIDDNHSNNYDGKKYNGKKICEDCNRARILLKTEPEVDQDE